MFTKPIKSPKKTLEDLLISKEVISGKEVIQRIKEQDKKQKEFDESVEIEVRYRARG
jgi:hypothetical protein